jgi:16S rRNA (uracil1498-N3)-methyltransferase
MRPPRVYTDQVLDSGQVVQLDETAARHLLKVLRLRPGDGLRLFNGDGREFAARLVGADHKRAQVAVDRLLRYEASAPLQLTLLFGIAKGERVDLAIQKAVELGVNRLHPLFANRTLVQLEGERLERRREHWHGVMISACEQSGRCRIPVLAPPGPLVTALRDCTADLRLLLDHRGETALPGLPDPRQGVDLLIGPEGGLEEQEVRLAREYGFTPVRLGPRILRTETAPLATLAAIQVLWGDFRGVEPGRPCDPPITLAQ